MLTVPTDFSIFPRSPWEWTNLILRAAFYLSESREMDIYKADSSTHHSHVIQGKQRNRNPESRIIPISAIKQKMLSKRYRKRPSFFRYSTLSGLVYNICRYCLSYLYPLSAFFDRFPISVVKIHLPLTRYWTF